MTPTLAVVIPTYRRPAALERTLRALAGEVGEGVEVVVCDDGSPPEEARDYERVVGACGFPARLTRQQNAGPAAARNHGARVSAAPRLLFLDDDCAPTPGLLREHLRDRTPGDRVAVMGHVAWAPHLRVTPFMELVVRGAQFNFGAIADPEDVPFTIFYTANCSVWREDLERAGWFDATLPPYMEDTEFAYRLTRSGVRIVYRPAALVHHEHEVELESYLDRQRRAGRASVEVVKRHPELFDVVGVGDVADVALREQFYSVLLRYAFVCGVEEGLAEQVDDGLVTGAELRGRFESWIASWAVGREADAREWRRRAEGLMAEVRRRDARLAEVVQEKDDRIAALEAQLRRLSRLLPVRAAQRLAAILRRR
ncbi:MAG TPA: glycosyltransferase [Chloroflexota bacterium]|nr:glycosyltransferase [Chloroflexota bacterium]